MKNATLNDLYESYGFYDKDKDIHDEIKQNKKPSKNRKFNKNREVNRSYRRKKEIAKYKRLYKIINSNGYNPAAGYVEWDYVDGKWVPVGQYIKYPQNSNAQRLLKRRSNKRVRRCDDIPDGNKYRRVIEYWWTLY